MEDTHKPLLIKILDIHPDSSWAEIYAEIGRLKQAIEDIKKLTN